MTLSNGNSNDNNTHHEIRLQVPKGWSAEAVACALKQDFCKRQALGSPDGEPDDNGNSSNYPRTTGCPDKNVKDHLEAHYKQKSNEAVSYLRQHYVQWYSIEEEEITSMIHTHFSKPLPVNHPVYKKARLRLKALCRIWQTSLMYNFEVRSPHSSPSPWQMPRYWLHSFTSNV